jgi:hypothetical protein
MIVIVGVVNLEVLKKLSKNDICPIGKSKYHILETDENRQH